MAEEEKLSPLEELVEESRKEYEQIQLELREIDVLIKQSTNEVNKLAQRNAQITNKMKQIEATFDTVPREDIQKAYTSAQDAQKRLFMMRGQLEKLQSDQRNLQRYALQLRRLLEATEGSFAKGEDGRAGVGPAQPAIVRVIEAQEHERQNLVQRLHDGPAQRLTNLILQAEICERLFDKDKERAREELTNLKNAVADTFQRVRNFMFDLRPMMLDDLGLIPTLKKYIEGFQEKSGIPTNLTITGKEQRLESHNEVTIFRVIQELVTNAERHAHCTSIEVSLDVDENWVRASVEDNGSGFDVEEVMQAVEQHKKVGLSTLRERVEMLGGQFHIDSGIGRGTKVSLEMPVGLG
jgi:two-component system sensor histidine kinase DegS